MWRKVSPSMPWLTKGGHRKIARLFARDYALHPIRFDRFLSRAVRLRMILLQGRQIERLAGAAGATVCHPYSHPEFVAALRTAGGRDGVGDRTSAMRQLFGDLLPDPVLRRESKARFDAAYWSDYSREFAAQWDGEGLDTTLVRPDALRADWSRPTGSAQTAIMLQSLWLRSRATQAAPR
jgi:asparagine synthase (glutamine-hydrolysing)